MRQTGDEHAHPCAPAAWVPAPLCSWQAGPHLKLLSALMSSPQESFTRSAAVPIPGQGAAGRRAGSGQGAEPRWAACSASRARPQPSAATEERPCGKLHSNLWDQHKLMAIPHRRRQQAPTLPVIVRFRVVAHKHVVVVAPCREMGREGRFPLGPHTACKGSARGSWNSMQVVSGPGPPREAAHCPDPAPLQRGRPHTFCRPPSASRSRAPPCAPCPASTVPGTGPRGWGGST